MGKLIDADALMETINARGTKSITIAVLQRLVDEAEEVKAEGTPAVKVDACESCLWYNAGFMGVGGCSYYAQPVAEPAKTRCVQYKQRMR